MITAKDAQIIQLSSQVKSNEKTIVERDERTKKTIVERDERINQLSSQIEASEKTTAERDASIRQISHDLGEQSTSKRRWKAIGIVFLLLNLMMGAAGVTAYLVGAPAGTPSNEPQLLNYPEYPMVWMQIEPGTFTMGSPPSEDGREDDEGPQHEVTISRGFLLQKTEVTQGQWMRLFKNNPSNFSKCGENCPVETMNWWEAVYFSNTLSREEGLEECYELRNCRGRAGNGMTCDEATWTKGLDCQGYRLPTEAEWEYAARAGTTTAVYTGPLEILGKNNAPALHPIAWYAGNSGVDYEGGVDSSGWPQRQFPHTRAGPHPVGLKLANGWGLHDMMGNVYEWVWDWHGSYDSGPATNTTGPTKGSDRVIRGGGWNGYARRCRAAYRYGREPGYRYGGVGFRLAKSR